jgi:N-acetylglucosamine-6-phosphate deacetylase
MNGPPHAIVAGTIFDGSDVRFNHAIVLEGSRISDVLPQGQLSRALPVTVLPAGAWLAPGFVDVQVNGGGDVLFNDEPNPDGIATIARAHRRFGTTSLLPTLITDTPAKMRLAVDAIGRAAEADPGILGVHFEGPFLSPEKPGVHDRAMIRTPDIGDLEILTSLRRGVTLVTLAPERAPAGFVSALVRAGVRVSLGHSMATYSQTKAALAEGLTGFTHLFNAMRPLASRDPGPIPAALETAHAYFGMIVDAVHVHPAMLRLALRGAAHPMLVTDAMPPVGGNRAQFMLHGEKIALQSGRCTRSDGALAGTALDMATAVRNCVEFLDIPLVSALRLASLEPAQFLGLGHSIGRIAPGFRADLVSFDSPTMKIHATWVAGKQEPA